MRWTDLTTEALKTWRACATATYLRDVQDPTRKKDGERSAGQLAAIDGGIRILRCIALALREKEA